MYHLPQRGGPVRKSLRPPLDLVERRRRERLEPAMPWWPRGASVRAAAATLLGGWCLCAFAGLAMATDGAGAMIASTTTVALAAPADAATMPAGFVVDSVVREHDGRVRARAHDVARHAHQLVSPERRAAVAPRNGDPSPATSAPEPMPAPSAPAAPPVNAGASSSGSLLSAQPWTLTADGSWTTTVSLALPAGVDPKRIDLDWSSDQADVLPLDQNATGSPGAIVTTDGGGPVDVAASASDGTIARQTLEIPAPPSGTAVFAATAQPIGARLVDLGWTRLPPASGVVEYKVYRRAAGASHGTLVAAVSPSGRTWHDDSVVGQTAYDYTVVASLAGSAVHASTGFVTTPAAPPATSVSAISGKGMFLYFTPDAGDGNAFVNYDPDAVIARARASGISHIEVRMARGTFVEDATPAAHAWLDDLVDKAAAAGIRLIAWQVPRRATSADAAAAVAAAGYTTPAGNGFAGLALDIEDGDAYMGVGDVAKERMVDQIALVREAVGPGYLVVATVMSPALTHWTNARYPFAGIAAYASVMQPMEYWHHFYSATHHAYTQDEVSGACAGSVSLTREQAGRDIPINVAGQSDDLGTTGAPSPDEIGWCLAAAKSAGAIGQTFFDWRGTGDGAWAAIADFTW